MEPIRVLQVVTTMERAGLETMLMNYYRHIDRSKVQFDFLRHRDGEHAYDQEILAAGGKIYTLPAVNPLNTNGYLTALDRFFCEHTEHRIVHAHLDCLSSIVLRYAKKHGVPIRIAHSHVSKMTFDIKYPIRVFYRAQIPSVATDLLACSQDAGRWMYGKHNFRIIPNAIDCAAFRYDAKTALALRHDNGLDGKFVIAHVGRFDPVKNHTFLLEVFHQIVLSHESSVLLLAGTGSTMEQIKAQAEARGIGKNVRFLGSVDNIPHVLLMADAFVFPSLYEGLGISLIEAQASGLPAFTAMGRVPESANITGTVQYIPLESGAKAWAEEIIKVKTSSSAAGRFKLLPAESGYDIAIEARKLQDYYLQKHMEDA